MIAILFATPYGELKNALEIMGVLPAQQFRLWRGLSACPISRLHLPQTVAGVSPKRDGFLSSDGCCGVLVCSLKSE
jgi:hypothetical protein